MTLEDAIQFCVDYQLYVNFGDVLREHWVWISSSHYGHVEAHTFDEAIMKMKERIDDTRTEQGD